MGESSWNGYENNCFFYNLGNDRFLEVGRASGGDSVRDSRGVGVADFDGDGRLDLVVNNNHAPPTLYLNRIADAGNWISLRLIGHLRSTASEAPFHSSRDAVGARARLTLSSADGRTRVLTRWVEAGSGYSSQSAFPLHFGLGPSDHIESLEVTWPSGRIDSFPGERFTINRKHILEETPGGAISWSHRARSGIAPRAFIDGPA